MNGTLNADLYYASNDVLGHDPPCHRVRTCTLAVPEGILHVYLL